MKKAQHTRRRKAKVIVWAFFIFCLFSASVASAQTGVIASNSAYTATSTVQDTGNAYRAGQSFYIEATTTVRTIGFAGDTCFSTGNIGVWGPRATQYPSSLLSLGNPTYQIAGRQIIGTHETGGNITRWSDATGITLAPGYYLFAEIGAGNCTTSPNPGIVPINSSVLGYSNGVALAPLWAAGASEYRSVESYEYSYGSDLVFWVSQLQNAPFGTGQHLKYITLIVRLFRYQQR